MSEDLSALLDILHVEQLDNLLFRGFTPPGRERRVYGGQVLAQAMNAATRTVDTERRIHSLHAYFLRPGDPNASIIYDVDPIRDGRSYSTRRVVARQAGRAIFSTSMSYQLPEQGLEHQDPMPDVPPPEDIEDDNRYRARLAAIDPKRFHAQHLHAIDYRAVDRVDPIDGSPKAPHWGVWMRTNGALPDDPGLHAAMLVYMSDSHLMSTAMRPHGMTWDNPRLVNASLDHGMWFYGASRADEWHYYDLASPRSGLGRGFNRGWIYSRNGRLVATVVQEGMMRLRDQDGVEG